MRPCSYADSAPGLDPPGLDPPGLDPPGLDPAPASGGRPALRRGTVDSTGPAVTEPGG